MRFKTLLHIIYTWAIILGGIALLVRFFPGINLDYAREMVVLIALVMVTEWLVVTLPHGQISCAYAVILGTFLMFGPAAAAWVNFLGVLFARGIVNHGNPIRTTFFDAAQYVFAVAAAFGVYMFCGGQPADRIGFDDMLPLGVFTLTYFAINHLLVYLYLLPRKSLFPAVSWYEVLYWDAATYLGTIPVAALMALLHDAVGFAAAVLLFIPVLAFQLVIRRSVRVELTNRELNVLSKVAMRLSNHLNLERLLDYILREIRRIIPYHTAMVYLWEHDQELFVPAAVRSPYARHLREAVMGPEEGLVGWAVERREPDIIPDTRSDSRLQREPGLSQFLRSFIVIPLLVEGEVAGVFLVGSRRPMAYDHRNLHILSIIASQVSLAVYNTWLNEQVDKVNRYADVVNLQSRREFLRQAREVFENCRRHNLDLAVIIINLDRFRKFNEEFGLAAGDRVLAQLADLLKAELREQDIVARYGGDEFAVLLPETPEMEAAQIAQQLREAVATHPFALGGGRTGYLTVSIGLSFFPGDADSFGELMHKADQALSLAKTQGGDAVAWCPKDVQAARG